MKEAHEAATQGAEKELKNAQPCGSCASLGGEWLHGDRRGVGQDHANGGEAEEENPEKERQTSNFGPRAGDEQQRCAEVDVYSLAQITCEENRRRSKRLDWAPR